MTRGEAEVLFWDSTARMLGYRIRKHWSGDSIIAPDGSTVFSSFYNGLTLHSFWIIRDIQNNYGIYMNWDALKEVCDND